MKYFQRDMDIIREILIVVGGLGSENDVSNFEKKLKDHDENFAFHVCMLIEAKYIDGDIFKSISAKVGTPYVNKLTWSGYDLLESIKDEVVWRKTKDACNKIGSFSIPIVQKAAAGILEIALKSLVT